MEAPQMGLSLEDLIQIFESHNNENYKRKDKKTYLCKKCGSQIIQMTCYVSVHYKGFSGCVGGGEVKQIPLPYCPKCEGEPKNTSTCIHV